MKLTIKVGDKVTNQYGETRTVADIGPNVVTFTDGRKAFTKSFAENIEDYAIIGQPADDYEKDLDEAYGFTV